MPFAGLIAWTPLGLPAFLFVITLVVFFHELGHFLVARAFGVKVDIFSIGFGTRDCRLDRPARHALEDLLAAARRLCEIRRRRRRRLARPIASAATRMTPAERAGALLFKPLYQRALVAAGGPLANFVLAIVHLDRPLHAIPAISSLRR